MIYLAVFLYAAAIVGANLIVAKFGPWTIPFNAFFLIGLDLMLRNWMGLQMRAVAMLALIVATGALTYVLNPAAQMIAIASSTAFVLAALADWGVFLLVKGPFLKRNLYGNTVGSAVDSVVFPTIAFGHLLPGIILLQFVAKIAGGTFWAYLITRIKREPIQG